jgi:hypothetical protein
MPPPGKDEVKTAVAALNADAAMWETAAGDLRSAAAVGDRLDLSRLQLTYLGDKVGLVEAYQKLQAHLVTVIGQGATNFDNVAAALRKAASDYQREDDAGAHAIDGATY